MFSLPVLVAAFGYFVDIYDLVLIGMVGKASLLGIGIAEHSGLMGASLRLVVLASPARFDPFCHVVIAEPLVHVGAVVA